MPQEDPERIHAAQRDLVHMGLDLCQLNGGLNRQKHMLVCRSSIGAALSRSCD